MKQFVNRWSERTAITLVGWLVETSVGECLVPDYHTEQALADIYMHNITRDALGQQLGGTVGEHVPVFVGWGEGEGG